MTEAPQSSTTPKSDAASTRFSDLSTHVKQAQENISKATAENRAELNKQVEHARGATKRRTTQLKTNTADAKDKAAESWKGVQDSWHSLTTRAHESADERHADHDAKHLEHRAERAEKHAINVVEFAYALIEESEYAVLEAVLARADADAAAPAAA